MKSSKPSKNNILIVDDQPLNLEVVTALLTDQGYQVQTALTGKSALRKAHEFSPDLILLDVRLPDMEGYEVCKQLKASERARDIPIIFVSVVDETADKVKAFAAGGVDYMTKPLQVEEVLARVETHLALRAMQKQLEEKNVQLEREIAKRRRVQERLRVLSLAVEKSPNSIAILDREGVIEYANPKLLELYELGPEQVIGKHWRTSLSPHSTLRERYAEIRKAVVEEGMIWRGEVADRARDGRVVWREAVLVPIKDAKGELVHTIYVSEDVTERKRAEEALRESEEKFRLISEQSLMGIVILQDGEIKYANQAISDLTGYHPGEIIGWKQVEFAERVHPDDQPFVLEQARRKQAGEEGTVEHYSYRIVTRTGEVRWGDQYSRTVEYQGRPADLITIVDITERKRAEEALRESEERYRQLVEISPDAIVVHSEGRIVLANAAGVELLGAADPEDLIGQPVMDFVHPDHREIVERRVQQVIERETAVPFIEQKVVRLDGTDVDVEVATTPLIYHGKPAAQVVARDITERKRAEEALRESEERYRAIFEQAADSIVLVDAKTGALVEFNDRAHENLGYTREEFEKLTIPDFEVTQSAEEVTKRIERIIEEGTDIFEAKQRTKSGEVREILVSGRAISVRGRDFVQGIWRDITERKRLEEQLRQQERLAAIGQLAGGIAHDFNNLLTSIMLYAQIIQSKPHLPPDLAPHVETILDESRRAARLVQQILDFSRRSMMESRPTDLVPCIEKTADILRRALPEYIHLVLDTGTGEHVVQADPTRIQQVVLNLATNARDAMPEGGELCIGLSRLKVKKAKDAPLTGMPIGEWVCLTVSDTGMGMTEEVRQHLFEPFFTTKPAGEGTGLGLAQVYGIVKQHGGDIGVETAAGHGTTFRVYLPAHTATAEETTREIPPLSPGAGETILLVEDKERLREVGQEILESLGYQVLTAANGRQALDAYRTTEKVDLVVTDLVMPEMSGVSLIQELKKTDPHAKALAITGYALTVDKRELKKAGIMDVIHKPFDANTLGEAVRRALDTDR